MTFAIRCTAKLLKRLGPRRGPQDAAPPTPTTLLGDWYATLLIDRGGHYIVACSEKTFLPVIIQARDVKRRLAARLSEEILLTLARLELGRWFIEHERLEMVEHRIAPTQSRVVLGVMNDYLYQIGAGPIARDALSDLAHQVARSPLSPLRTNNPIDATVGLAEQDHRLIQ